MTTSYRKILLKTNLTWVHLKINITEMLEKSLPDIRLWIKQKLEVQRAEVLPLQQFLPDNTKNF